MSYSVSRVNWKLAEPLLKDVRERVFICERRIPKKIEFDRKDRTAYHMLICDDISQEPIATGRILPSGEIGRIAVLMEHRKQQIDKIIIAGLIRIAKDISLEEVFIHSPLEAVDYFRKNNFYTVGSVFMEAGIPRQRMACSVDSIANTKCYLSH
jgi:predicted GNAT family N-acyltransferase